MGGGAGAGGDRFGTAPGACLELGAGVKTLTGLREVIDDGGEAALATRPRGGRPWRGWGAWGGAGGPGEPLPVLHPPVFSQLGVFVPPHAVKLPEEPITRWGEYWCDVTVSERPPTPPAPSHPLPRPPQRPLEPVSALPRAVRGRNSLFK